MKMLHPKPAARVFAAAIVVCFFSDFVSAQENQGPRPQLHIVADPAPPAIHSEKLNQPQSIAAPDLGELLMSIAGVNGSRMGGHGIDPVIRGQGQSRINVLRDGEFLYGGCPNRMDPASSYLQPGLYDTLTVTKGIESLRYGPGGAGGTVMVERLRPAVRELGDVKTRANASFESNGDRRMAGADIAAGLGGNSYLRLGGTLSDGHDYKDGGGNAVRSAFEQNVAAAEIGAGHNGNSLAASFDLADGDDILYAGSEMDAPDSDNFGTGIKARVETPGKQTAIQSQLYFNRVDHLMDNYTLRPLAAGRMPMFADTRAETAGGRVGVETLLGPVQTDVGIDFRALNQQAQRFMIMNGMESLQSVLWPDVNQITAGSYLEGEWQVNVVDTVNLGLRYDRVKSDDQLSTRKPSGQFMSPAELYTLYYGEESGGGSDDNLSALASAEHKLSEAVAVKLGFARSVRSPDISERFIASNAKMEQDRWIGDPSLEPEVHHIISPSLGWREGESSASAALFYDWTSDFIARDRARGQSGISRSDLANIYRNVEAQLWGGELEAETPLSDLLILRAWAAYVNATNETDDRPLPQIPPLNGGVVLSFKYENLSIEPGLNFTATQHRTDTDIQTGSGLDKGDTSGVVTADLAISYKIADGLNFDLIGSNLLDKNYANHLNRGSVFDADAASVNEPGRSILAQIRYEN